MKVKLLAACAAVGVVALFVGRCTGVGREVQFVMGGALVDVGYGLQDGLESYDFEHDHEIGPEEVWDEMLRHNRLSSGMRSRFPRATHHPLVALLVCMDARIDTNELVGDTRRFYYVVRTAGSVMSEREEEMLELAVANGVKLVVLTTHSDCAAEKVAASAELRPRFPALGRAVDEREARVASFIGRPAIAAAVQRGELAVKRVAIETLTDQLVER